MPERLHPKVFVSYSHDDRKHERRVGEFTDRLRANGINAVVDQHENFPEQGWPAWCKQHIEDADHVLLVCTETYRRRMDGKEAVGTGLGVCWEGPIIQQLLYDASGRGRKVIPVMFADGTADYIPAEVRRFTRFIVDREDGFEDLCRLVLKKPRRPPPPLGPTPNLLSEERPPFAALVTEGATKAEREGAHSVAIDENLDFNRPITIKRLRKQERIDADIIANVAFNPSGDLMAYSLDERLFLLSLSDIFPEKFGSHERAICQELGQYNSGHENKITDICFSPCGRLIVSADSSGHILFWSIDERRSFVDLYEHDDAVTNIVFSPKGDRFASASYDEDIFVWATDDVLSGKPKPIQNFQKKSNIKRRPRYKHDIEQITAIAFSYSGKHLASGDQQGMVVVREVATGEVCYRRKVHNDRILAMAFSPAQKGLLATASGDTRIRLTNVLLGESEQPATLGVGEDKHNDFVLSIAFSYKGDILVSSSADRCVKIWDVQRRILLYNYCSEVDRQVEKVVFCPNQYDFATDCYCSDISLWDIVNEGAIQQTKIELKY